MEKSITIKWVIYFSIYLGMTIQTFLQTAQSDSSSRRPPRSNDEEFKRNDTGPYHMVGHVSPLYPMISAKNPEQLAW